MPGKRRLCVLLCAAWASILVVSSATAATLSARESALVEHINEVRAEHRLAPLDVDFRLVRAAREHSRAMLRHGIFAHGDFATRLRTYGVRFPILAENLAWGTGSYASARWIVGAWLASPGHRANLLHPRFRKIGIGAPVGTFSGYRGAAVVTADFGGF
jgi:uncharacterized protein YkwD